MPGDSPTHFRLSLDSLTLNNTSHQNSNPSRSFYRPEDDASQTYLYGTGGTPSPSPPPAPFLSASDPGSRDLMGRDARTRSDETPFVPLASDGSPVPLMIAPDHEGYGLGAPPSGAYDNRGSPIPQGSRYGPPGRHHEWGSSSDSRAMRGPYPSRAATFPPGGSPYYSYRSPSPRIGGHSHRSSPASESQQGVDPREIQGQDIDEGEAYLRRRLRMPFPMPLCLASLPDSAPGAKPPTTYITLAILAIYESPQKKLSQRDICAAIMERYPWFREHERTVQWKNSIRHMLSFQGIFRRRRRPVTEPGKGDYWCLDFHTYPDGLKRPRKRNKKGKKGDSRAFDADEDAYDDDDADDESDYSSETSSPELGQMDELPRRASPVHHHGQRQPESRTWSPMTRRPESGRPGPDMGLRSRDRRVLASTTPNTSPPLLHPIQGRPRVDGQPHVHPSFGQPGFPKREPVSPPLPSSLPPQFSPGSGSGYMSFGPPPTRSHAGDSSDSSAPKYASSASASARNQGKSKRSD